MRFATELLDLLEAQERPVDETIVWRGVLPRRGRPLTRTQILRPNERGARWNSGSLSTLYASLERETLRAEVAHLLTLQPATRDVEPVFAQLRVRISRVVDLSDPSSLAQVGIDRATLERDDHSPCQHVGDAAAWLGMGGLLVPSARQYPKTNLAIYVGHLQSPDFVELIDSPDELGGPFSHSP